MNAAASQSRAEARRRSQRKRILCAAEACFVESGFHAASMAAIADTAGMSPGLIYRYFENKNAIILAIIEQQLMIARKHIRELRSAGNLADRIMRYFESVEPEDDDSMSTPLYLEISAEATRDPQIAEALQHFDRTVRSELTEWLCRDPADGGYGLSSESAPTVVLLLVSLFEGLIVRGAREPEPDCRQLRRKVEHVLSTVIESTV